MPDVARSGGTSDLATLGTLGRKRSLGTRSRDSGEWGEITAERRAPGTGMDAEERDRHDGRFTDELAGSGDPAVDTDWGDCREPGSPAMVITYSIGSKERSEAVPGGRQHATVERASDGRTGSIRGYQNGARDDPTERLLYIEGHDRRILSHSCSSAIYQLAGDCLAGLVLRVPVSPVRFEPVARYLHDGDRFAGGLLASDGDSDIGVLRRLVRMRLDAGAVSENSRVYSERGGGLGYIPRSGQGQSQSDTTRGGVGVQHRYNQLDSDDSVGEAEGDSAASIGITYASESISAVDLLDGIILNVVSTSVATCEITLLRVVSQLFERRRIVGRADYANGAGTTGLDLGSGTVAQVQRSTLQLGTGGGLAYRDGRSGDRLGSALGLESDRTAVDRQREGGLGATRGATALQRQGTDGPGARSTRPEDPSGRWTGGDAVQRQHDDSVVHARGRRTDREFIRDRAERMENGVPTGYRLVTDATHPWSPQFAGGQRIAHMGRRGLDTRPGEVRRTESEVGSASSRSVREQREHAATQVQFTEPMPVYGGSGHIHNVVGGRGQLLVPAGQLYRSSVGQDNDRRSGGRVDRSGAADGLMVETVATAVTRPAADQSAHVARGRDGRIARASAAVRDALDGAAGPSDARARVAKAVISLAWERSTDAKYTPLVVAFEADYGAVRLIEKELLVPYALSFASGYIIKQQHAQARVAVSALARAIGLCRGVRIHDDARVTAFLKGLEKYQHLLKPPSTKRDPLPAAALVKFVLDPPADMSLHDRLVIAALLSVGIRCIRRPGELADLREDQLKATRFGAEIRLLVTKSDPTARGLVVPFEKGSTPACPIACLDRYLRFVKGQSLDGWSSNRSDRFLFVDAHGRPFRTDKIKDMVRLVARRAGLEGAFGGHSIRITGACLAVLGGMTLEQVMAIGGWKSRAVEIYLRGIVAVASSASNRMGL